ncbi:hypothetical protein Taro_020425 [Colocasia esculenta]|uniref:FAD dependent oxidoreductase domain-containing protein n=1 Tax=Colocasia esculenta TaxID=4460 RepID=A0A843V2A9_COLES|nr:hypothetical protein [Colocasia esculenta]
MGTQIPLLISATADAAAQGHLHLAQPPHPLLLPRKNPPGTRCLELDLQDSPWHGTSWRSLPCSIFFVSFPTSPLETGEFRKSPKESPLCVDVYDEIGIGGGASGVAGGLIHPYSPKGKLLWRGAEFWRECLKLLSIAERAPTVRARDGVSADLLDSPNEQIVWRRGIVRPATTLKNAEILKENAQGCLDSCSIKILDQYAVQKLVPGSYNGVIICLGAKADMLPELSGILPLRMCRGVVAHMKLPDDIREPYGSWSPSVLSDAWLAVQGPRTAIMGSTWQWGSRDYSSRVSPEEGCRAFEELLPKASVVYPAVKQWEFVGASGGLRAMPPLTALGSLPLLGCVNDLVGEKFGCNYWLIGGLGARGLLYHGLLGKLTAQAVISSNEGILPSELTSWKKLKFAKGKMTGHLGEKERIKG